MTFPSLSGSEWTFPPRDYVPVTPGASVLPGVVRGIYCNADGTLVFRCIDSDADRTLTVAAGQFVVGFVTQVLAGTDCEPFAVM